MGNYRRFPAVLVYIGGVDQRIVYLTPGIPTLFLSMKQSSFIERKLAEERVSTIRKGILGTATTSLRLCCSESRNFLHSSDEIRSTA